ncbi:MAG TPA: VacJ family lipoprotein [Steroidobacteraceae bacterium]|jgi:phospholipid-binding lipoprotein MlaA|nr:VacJ family lipoprotein [Steroidobacteraceae bacterium]
MRANTTRALLSALCLLLLYGCATLPPGPRNPRDPWERMNRATYRFNDKLDKAILRPVARGYQKVTPQFAQTGVRNFFDNLNYTIVMLNDLLQGQIKPFCSDTARLVVNTTIGIGGLFDPATRMGLDKNDRDLGQTFGKWGIKTGPYVVLPLLGPSDVRDAFGRLGDDFSTPRQYIRNVYWNYGLWALDAVDTRARLLPVDRLLDSAYDPYAFMRNAYLQRRDFKVYGGQSPNEEEQEQKLFEESGEDATPAGSPPAPTAPPATPAAPQTPPPH